ncbi:MAG: LptA/OstA family protein [bacterium]
MLLLAAPPTETLDIQAARLELDQATGQATFSGDVVVRQGELVLRCAVLEARYGDDGEVDGLVASGGVTVTQGELSARAETARYLRAEDRLELAGHPEVTRGKDRLGGARIVYWPGQGRLVVEQARGRIQAPRITLPRPPG